MPRWQVLTMIGTLLAMPFTIGATKLRPPFTPSCTALAMFSERLAAFQKPPFFWKSVSRPLSPLRKLSSPLVRFSLQAAANTVAGINRMNADSL
jgi:hypothetical protein